MPDTAMPISPDYGLSRLRVGASPLFLRESEVRRGVDLLTLGHGQLMRQVDPLLRNAGVGRAHCRMLSHVVRWPGLAMGDLIELTGTSKQALTRVARELAARGLVEVRPGVRDRRRRELSATPAGSALMERIDKALAVGMADAYAGAGQEAVTGFWRVLEGLVPVSTRMHIAEWEKAR